MAELKAYIVFPRRPQAIKCNTKFLDKSSTAIQRLQLGDCGCCLLGSVGFQRPSMASALGAAASASRQLKRGLIC